MAKKTLEQLVEECKAKGIELSGTETQKDLVKLLKDAGEDESGEEDAAPVVVDPRDTNDAYKTVASDGVFPVRPLTSKAFNMASVISKQPKVTTIVPLRDDETIGGSFHVWQENGFKIHVLKGVAVQLPQQVAKAITDEYTNTAKATREVQVRNPITGEIVNMNIDQKSEQDRARLGL